MGIIKKKKSRTDRIDPKNLDRPDRDILRINKLILEQEWEEHPRLAQQYAEEAADAQFELDTAKAAFELNKAKLDKKIRGTPTEYGLGEKPTEGGIKSAIALDAINQKKELEVRKLKHHLDVLNAFVRSLVDRRRALENYVTLHGQGYWSVPRTDNQELREEMTTRKKKKARRAGKE